MTADVRTTKTDAKLAARRVWLVFWITVVGGGAGLAWDGWWHVHIAWGGFFMPPHLLIYGSVAFAAFLVWRLLRDGWLHPVFARGGVVRLPGLARPVPGGLLALGVPFLVLGAAGMLDAIWHTAFGLDETRWSLPHNLLAWGFALVVLGTVTARLSIETGPPRTWVMVGLGCFGLSLAGPFLGPLGHFSTVEHAVAVSRIPVLAADPNVQAALRLVIDNGLTKTNPVFLLLGSLWLGLGAALLHRLDPRPRYLVAVAVLFTVLDLGDRSVQGLEQYVPGLSQEPAVWLPAPALPFVLTFLAARRLRRRESRFGAAAGGGMPGGPRSSASDRVAYRTGRDEPVDSAAWALAGAVATVLWIGAFGMPAWAVLLLPLAAAAAALGARLGDAGGNLALRPTGRRLGVLLLLVLGASSLAGTADLILRAVTA